MLIILNKHRKSEDGLFVNNDFAHDSVILFIIHYFVLCFLPLLPTYSFHFSLRKFPRNTLYVPLGPVTLNVLTIVCDAQCVKLWQREIDRKSYNLYRSNIMYVSQICFTNGPHDPISTRPYESVYFALNKYKNVYRDRLIIYHFL